jgi:hypothetical protein
MLVLLTRPLSDDSDLKDEPRPLRVRI